MKYSVYRIKTYDKIEQLGTKEKFWFYDKATKDLLLCKIGRPGTGENWAEKITCEIANILSIPCATYDFAVWEKKECVISKSFVPEHSQLIHGNELLAKLVDQNYPSVQRYKVIEYTISTIKDLFSKEYSLIDLPIGYKENDFIKTPGDMFIAYLMFDCLVANQDRHHENWGFIMDNKNQKLYLAPTYDHASGLGCRVSEKERVDRLKTHDKRYNINAFAKKAKTPIYGNNSKRLTTLDAFIQISNMNKVSTDYWLEKISLLSEESLRLIFDKVPRKIISCAAIDFAVSLVLENRNRLLSKRER